MAPLRPKWTLKKADWPAFQQGVEEALQGAPQPASGANADVLYKRLAEAVLGAARKHIGQSKGRGKKCKCWWSAEAAGAVRARREAGKRAEETGLREDVSAWRRAERDCKKTVRSAKSRAWKDFASDLDRNGGCTMSGFLEIMVPLLKMMEHQDMEEDKEQERITKARRAALYPRATGRSAQSCGKRCRACSHAPRPQVLTSGATPSSPSPAKRRVFEPRARVRQLMERRP